MLYQNPRFALYQVSLLISVAFISSCGPEDGKLVDLADAKTPTAGALAAAAANASGATGSSVAGPPGPTGPKGATGLPGATGITSPPTCPSGTVNISVAGMGPPSVLIEATNAYPISIVGGFLIHLVGDLIDFSNPLVYQQFGTPIPMLSTPYYNFMALEPASPCSLTGTGASFEVTVYGHVWLWNPSGGSPSECSLAISETYDCT